FGGVFAATENGTTLAGAFGMVTFAQEAWRWRGFIGRPDVNLDFYGENTKVGYNLHGWATTQMVQRRLGESENFVGARWNYIDFDARFDSAREQPLVLGSGQTIRSSGLGVFFEHDSRDNFFTASRGWKLFAESVFYSPDLGSDEEYQMYRAQLLAYFPLARQLILGGRADARAARGEVPFYQLPYIEMRGIPFFRYQNEDVALAEAELRWNLTPRWALVAFAGIGKAAESVSAWGVGFRRLVARRLGIYMGVDLARGPEETAIYIQAGSAWR
ncbi:MAG TPA: glyceraldehyde-3-phosphate dehydrogenase, partial [Burkholderiales bacterium]